MGQFTIKMDEDSELPSRCFIVTISGAVVMEIDINSNSEIDIDLSKAEKGVYLIHLVNNEYYSPARRVIIN